MISPDFDLPPEPLVIPPEVETLLAEAVPPYAAVLSATSILLIEEASGQIIREVQWDRAGEWARNAWADIMAAAARQGLDQQKEPTQ